MSGLLSRWRCIPPSKHFSNVQSHFKQHVRAIARDEQNCSNYVSDTEMGFETLDNYCPGGYHPTEIGDVFKQERYQIVHKLGWGSYRMVWLAKDRLRDRFTALKLLAAEESSDDQEVRMLGRLSKGPPDHPGKKHIVHMLDQFRHYGPNGIHTGLVMELLGPSISSLADSCDGSRLPTRSAWNACKQVAVALDYIHMNDIVHGDLRCGNIGTKLALASYQNETGIIGVLGEPTLARLSGTWRKSFPKYLVAPALLPIMIEENGAFHCKVFDFGASYLTRETAHIRCAIPFRPPEAFFVQEWTKEADIWSLGCTIFEMITGKPPFGNSWSDSESLTEEWILTLGPLPQEWNDHLLAPDSLEGEQSTDVADLLRKVYFYEGMPCEGGLSETHIEMAGELLNSVLRYRPGDGPTASEILRHSWFEKNLLNDQWYRSAQAADPAVVLIY